MAQHLTAAPDQYVHYDVFVSFCDYNCIRDANTRDANTFAIELGKRLESRKIESYSLKVYLDKAEWLFDGKIHPKRVEAILAASVHIVIFTPNFAQSKWSLDELVLMIKSSAESMTSIIPIFYYTVPSAIRWQGNGPYGRALGNYENRKLYDPQTIEQWRDALSHVAGITGFVVDRDDDELFDKVVESVLQDFSSVPRYDIFLNHRGPDLKETFVTDLYDRLVSCGFKVFFDKPEMKAGLNITRQIELAIQVAYVNIAIFSPTYAESRWCLDELVLMRRSSRTVILPVFYNVKHCDLHCPKDGVYTEAICNEKNNQRYDSETILNWIKVLSEVAQLPGLTLNGNQEKLLTEIVERVKDNLAQRSQDMRSSELQSWLKRAIKEDDPKRKAESSMESAVKEDVSKRIPVSKFMLGYIPSQI